MTKIALITGIAGQDGFYLSEFLRAKGYEVHGVVRPGKEAPLSPRLCTRLHYADFAEGGNLGEILRTVRPDEVYHLAGLSRVSASFADPTGFANVNGLGTARLLEAIRRDRDESAPQIRFYQASTSEMFGSTGLAPICEETPFRPQSPYATSKVFAHLQTIHYREAFGLFACCGILFNHESPRRDEHFVTRKITATAARIKAGLSDQLRLGNMDVRRDWGFAGDYVEAMWLMLQQDRPDDFVIATGQTHSVREFVAEVFSRLDLDAARHVVVDRELFRPAEIQSICGDASKARRLLGWQPRVSFHDLASMMADYDLERVRTTCR